jgi:hypothetical protein
MRMPERPTFREYIIAAGVFLSGGHWRWFFGVKVPRVLKWLVTEGRYRSSRDGCPISTNKRWPDARVRQGGVH